jgi:hypothetical protein
MAGNLPDNPEIPTAQDFFVFPFDASEFDPIDPTAEATAGVFASTQDASVVHYNAHQQDPTTNVYVQPEDTTNPNNLVPFPYDDSSDQSNSSNSNDSSGEEEDNQPILLSSGMLRCNWLLNKETESRCEKERSRPCDLKKHRKTHKPKNKCEVPGCTTRPKKFAEKKELYRHYAMHHEGTRWADHPRAKAVKVICGINGCKYKGRKDNVEGRHREKKHS